MPPLVTKAQLFPDMAFLKRGEQGNCPLHLYCWSLSENRSLQLFKERQRDAPCALHLPLCCTGLSVHLSKKKGWVLFLPDVPERSKHPGLHSSLTEIALCSYRTTTPFSWYFLNGRMRCGCCVAEQRETLLIHSILALHFLGLQIRMQKRDAVPALANVKGTFLHISDMWSYQQTAFSFQ